MLAGVYILFVEICALRVIGTNRSNIEMNLKTDDLASRVIFLAEVTKLSTFVVRGAS